MIDEVIAFLNARLDDREELARTVTLNAGYDGFGTAWALRDITAKRRIIALYTYVHMSEPWGDNPSMPLGGEGPEIYFDVLCLMAMIDAAHPDYQSRWNTRDFGQSLRGLEA